MHRIRLSWLLVALAALLSSATLRSARAEDIVDWKPGEHPKSGKGSVIFRNEHDESFIWNALEELSGQRPAAKASRSELADAVLAELDKLPKYGQRSTANMQGPVPEWVTDAYSQLGTSTLPSSRYMKYYTSGQHPEFFGDDDLVRQTSGLYGFFCMYDAEWFSVARIPAYKAWLSALALTYTPHWAEFKGQGDKALHSRLVTPIQTKDEPWREIDNWITAFTRPELDGEPVVFVKPLVRSAMVAELLDNAGMEADPRFLEERAYTNSAPDLPGLDERQADLLAALTLELCQEIYEQDSTTRQPLWVRDWLLERYNALK